MEKICESKRLFARIKEDLFNAAYIIPTVISAVVCYMYFLTTEAIGIDDTVERYYEGELFSQGRFTSTIINNIFNIKDNNILFSNLIGIISIIFAAIVFCIIFEKIISCNNFEKVIFSCLLITSPIFVEIFSYRDCVMSIGCGILLIAIALYNMQDYFETRKKWNVIISSLALMVAASWYEAVLFVYVTAVFGVLILKYVVANTNNEKVSLKQIITEGLIYALPLIIGVAFELIFEKAAFLIFGLERSTIAKNFISISNFNLSNLISVIAFSGYRYIIAGLYYFPITMFLIATVIFLILCIYYTKKQKSFVTFLLFLGLFISIFGLTLITLSKQEYRTSQTIAFFVAFVFFMLIRVLPKKRNKKVTLRKIAAVLFVYLIILQISCCNYWYYWDEMRWQEEKNTLNQVGYTLIHDFDTSKPVVFVGKYELSDYIKEKTCITQDSLTFKSFKFMEKTFFKNKNSALYKSLDAQNLFGDESGKYGDHIPQTITNSVIQWSMGAFYEVNTELLHLFKTQGYTFKQGTEKMQEQATKASKDMPQWPHKDSIKDMGEYIVVNF